MVTMVLGMVLGLTACGPSQPESTFVNRVTGEFVVTHAKPPKRFYVSLRDVDTGAVYNRLYVSKRCHKWRKLRVGAVIRLPKETRELPDGRQYVKILDVHKICDRL